MESTEDKDLRMGTGGLYRHCPGCSKVIAILTLEGNKVWGAGDDIQAALLDAFTIAYPEINTLDIKLPALLQLPKFEDLPILNEVSDTYS